MLKLLLNKKYERIHSDENLLAYVKYSNGAIELHEDYVVFYANWLPFESFVQGRIATIINIKDIDSITYKGSGLMPAFFFVRMKGVRTFWFLPAKWFPWTNKKLNPKLREVYQYMFEKTTLAWKNENYRKIQTFDDIKKQGNCPICGGDITSDTAFCTTCGAKIGGANE